eukprot:741096-Hanusia_phi.AAC.3
MSMLPLQGMGLKSVRLSATWQTSPALRLENEKNESLNKCRATDIGCPSEEETTRSESSVDV